MQSSEEILMEAEAVANHRKGTLISMVYKRERTKRI